MKADGKTVNTLYTEAQGAGLAHLRFKLVTDDMRPGDAVVRPVAPLT